MSDVIIFVSILTASLRSLQNIYEDAWKCEKDGFNGGDETMCAYIESVSVKMEDGSATSMSSSSGMMTFLTTVFSLSTIGLAGYTWYLKDKVSKVRETSREATSTRTL